MVQFACESASDSVRETIAAPPELEQAASAPIKPNSKKQPRARGPISAQQRSSMGKSTAAKRDVFFRSAKEEGMRSTRYGLHSQLANPTPHLIDCRLPCTVSVQGEHLTTKKACAWRVMM